MFPIHRWAKKLPILNSNSKVPSDATACRLQCYGEKIAESKLAAGSVLSAKDSHKNIIRYINSRVRRDRAGFS
jgi:hypothetical protein